LKHSLQSRRVICVVHRAGRLLRIALLLLLFPLLLWAQYRPFAIIGDTHVGSTASAYRIFIDSIDRQGIRIIIHLGDAIDRAGNKAQWEEFLRITGVGKTVHLIPGNHDVDSDRSQAVFTRLFGRTYYTFSEGDTLFIMLDTELPGESGMVTGVQFEWLESELQRPFRYNLVFLHEPPFPEFPGHGLDRHRDARDRLHELFVRTGVSLVVAGHDHVYHRSLRDGIPYVIASGGGGRLYLPASNGGFLHYVVGTRSGDTYSFVVKDMKGAVRDQFSIGQ
jgi:3',5'-cyclic AMP phosphodiesterase CpdA